MKLALFFVASVMNPCNHVFQPMFSVRSPLSWAPVSVCFYLVESIFWYKQIYDDKRKGYEFEGLSVKIDVNVNV